MYRKLCLFACAAAALAAVPPGYQHWTAEQMRARNRALPGKMDALKDAAETIGSFGNHSIIASHREASGKVEVHENKVDIMFIESGGATMLVGGKVQGGKETAPHEIRGSGIEGGERQALHPGDILHIPARTPHQFLLDPGQKIDYYTVKVAVP
jgi:mannose-6-phosphate isomerase-like protein (cupin superfamily)